MKLEHEFVEFIPKEPEGGKLYISIRFKTAVHLCACGCGIKTVTPLSPTDWRLTFDGTTVSLYPSIGNWGFPCRSHYWITNNELRWSTDWSDEEIRYGRDLNRLAKEKYFNQPEEKLIVQKPKVKKSSWWKFKWLFKPTTK